MSDPEHGDTITLSRAAAVSGLNRKTIKAAIDRGDIHAWRRQESGSSPYLLDRDEFDEWLRGRPVN